MDARAVRCALELFQHCMNLMYIAIDASAFLNMMSHDRECDLDLTLFKLWGRKRETLSILLQDRLQIEWGMCTLMRMV